MVFLKLNEQYLYGLSKNDLNRYKKVRFLIKLQSHWFSFLD